MLTLEKTPYKEWLARVPAAAHGLLDEADCTLFGVCYYLRASLSRLEQCGFAGVLFSHKGERRVLASL